MRREYTYFVNYAAEGNRDGMGSIKFDHPIRDYVDVVEIARNISVQEQDGRTVVVHNWKLLSKTWR